MNNSEWSDEAIKRHKWAGHGSPPNDDVMIRGPYIITYYGDVRLVIPHKWYDESGTIFAFWRDHRFEFVKENRIFWYILPAGADESAWLERAKQRYDELWNKELETYPQKPETMKRWAAKCK